MKVLVTGSSGLVGRAFQWITQTMNDINDTYIFLTSKDADLTREDDVRKIFEKHQPDAVVHIAANVGGLFKNMNCKSQMYEDNILMNTFVLKYARLFYVKKVVMLLSTCVFPDGKQVTEDMLHNGPPHPSNEGYAYSKRMMEVHARILHTQHAIQTICLTPTNIYGPFDNFDLQNAHVVPALIYKCYLAKKENKPFVICGSGKPLRQFIYSFDMANIIHAVLQDHKVSTGHYICAPPSKESEITIDAVARLIAKEMDYEHAITYDTSYSDGQYKKTVEPHPLIEDLPFTSMEKGLKTTIQWFMDNIDKGIVRI